MRLNGLHHVTAITGDAQRTLDFYVEVLGLRFVKKTVNFDAPEMYHLYLGSEDACPGSLLTFFEFPGTVPGRAGAGMVNRITWRVDSDAAIAFWLDRLAEHGIDARHEDQYVAFADPEGLGLELWGADEPGARHDELAAGHPDIPERHALRGLAGVSAYCARPETTGDLLTGAMNFEHLEPGAHAFTARGVQGHAHFRCEPPPSSPGRQGAGTVHHVAFCCEDSDHHPWRRRIADAGVHVTAVKDRQYFRSIYFREPSGVLFEIATEGPGFTVDEARADLGDELQLPDEHEHLRERLTASLGELHNPRHRHTGV